MEIAALPVGCFLHQLVRRLCDGQCRFAANWNIKLTMMVVRRLFVVVVVIVCVAVVVAMVVAVVVVVDSR